MDPRTETTEILARLGKHDALPDAAATERLFRIAYDELLRLAASKLRQEKAGHSLDAVALVSEVYLRLVEGQDITWRTRAHFLAIAARAMRQVLIDRARRKAAVKHGGGLQQVAIDSKIRKDDGDLLEVLVLNEALDALSANHERVGRVAEMRIFGDLEFRDIAASLGVSARTTFNDWSFARMWLRRWLEGRAPADPRGGDTLR